MLRAAKKVERQALRVGNKVLDGRKFEGFDTSLLSVGDSDINDHVDAQSSGLVYYGMLVRLAQENLRDAEIRFENWYAKVYNKCNELLKSEIGIKRPNKIDVDNKVKKDYFRKYGRLKKIVMKKEYIVDRLNIWYSSWVAKGFSLGGLTDRESRKTGRDTRSLIGRSRKHVEEED